MPVYRQIPLDQLVIDEGYQRDIDQKHVDRIADEWEDAQFGVLEVSQRSTAHHAIFDGQHRYYAARKRGETHVPCLVHTGLTPKQEAELFTALQDRRKALTPIDRFKSRLFAEDPVAVGMNEVTTRHNYQIGTGPKSIQGVVFLERVYRRGNLDETLAIMGIWRGDAKQLEGSVIDGMSRFLDLFNEADRQRCRSQWAEVSPTVVLRRAAEFMATALSSKAAGVLEVLRDLYTSRQWPLPSVQKAVAERKAVQSEGRTRYRRVTGEEVRDAILELSPITSEGGRARFTVQQLRDKTGASRASLTKRGAIIDQFIDRGMLVRHRSGGQGPYEYEYIDPDRQKPRRRRNGGDETRRNGGATPVPYTGRPQQRTGGQNKRQRDAAARGRKIVQPKK